MIISTAAAMYVVVRLGLASVDIDTISSFVFRYFKEQSATYKSSRFAGPTEYQHEFVLKYESVPV